MKKQKLLIISSILVVILIGSVFANGGLIGGIIGGIIGGLPKTDKVIPISQDKLDVIKQKAGVDELNIEAGDIICNSRECWADIYSPDVIQTQWRNPKGYCSQYEVITETINDDIPACSKTVKDNCYKPNQKPTPIIIEHQTGNCIEYTDYTNEELQSMRDSFIEQRLNDYVNSIINDNEETSQAVVRAGSIKLQ